MTQYNHFNNSYCNSTENRKGLDIEMECNDELKINNNSTGKK